MTGLIISIVLAVLAGLAMWRNFAVFNYSIRLASLVHDRNVEDIEHSKNLTKPNQRWEELGSVTYSQMMLRFWKPLDSFYDKQFLEEIGAI